MSKKEIKYFSAFYVDKLYRQVAATENCDNYLLNKFPFEETYSKGPTEIFLDDKFELDPDDSDLNNSIALYEAMKGLTEVQASDERLWVYLTHGPFWSYMRKRWPVEVANKPISRIKERYFLRNLNLQSLTRNGLSRLWWYAHITYDQGRDNKYELLEVMLQRQDLVVGITERAIGTNERLRIAILEFLKENPPIATDETKTRELLKGLNLCGGVRILPLLDVAEIKRILEQVNALKR